MIELSIISIMFFAAGFGWGWILRKRWIDYGLKKLQQKASACLKDDSEKRNKGLIP
ncbi:hypothetical protein LCGC14_0236360 [marine sediment metagenome]|uniref:Uncharacterized protein n=1 Tax=marine sediment metagenome TaxID=412755 RepID=A0A0F9XDE7_9ZZZZ